MESASRTGPRVYMIEPNKKGLKHRCFCIPRVTEHPCGLSPSFKNYVLCRRSLIATCLNRRPSRFSLSSCSNQIKSTILSRPAHLIRWSRSWKSSSLNRWWIKLWSTLFSFSSAELELFQVFHVITIRIHFPSIAAKPPRSGCALNVAKVIQLFQKIIKMEH